MVLRGLAYSSNKGSLASPDAKLKNLKRAIIRYSIEDNQGGLPKP